MFIPGSETSENSTFTLDSILLLLNKFEQTKNFFEKFFILEMSLNQLRLEMIKVQTSTSASEIDSKEVLNALLIVLLLNSSLDYPMAHLVMVDDYVSLCKEYENEKNVTLKYKVNIKINNFLLETNRSKKDCYSIHSRRAQPLRSLKALFKLIPIIISLS